MKILAVIFLSATVTLFVAQTSISAAQNSAGSRAGSATEAMYRAAAASADAKLRHIETNGDSAHPDQTPIVLTEREINAYMASGKVKLPKGVSQLRFSGAAGMVTTNALVDFDKVTEGKKSSNPLMGLFSGTHQVEVASHAQGSGGQGRVQIDSVSIDGIGVPRIALEYFATRYIKPKYPNLGLDSQFALPDRIDTATIGDHVLTLIQR
jgi:hypothetical protein